MKKRIKSYSGQIVTVMILLSGLLSILPQPAQAQGGVENSTKNPQQIAILHWYTANQTTAFAWDLTLMAWPLMGPISG